MGELTKGAFALWSVVQAMSEATKQMAPLARLAGGVGMIMIGASVSYFAQCMGALLCIGMGT